MLFLSTCSMVDRYVRAVRAERMVLALMQHNALIVGNWSYLDRSELNLPLPPSFRPGEWTPNICSLVGAASYVNPVGGQELFDPDEFSRRGVDLYFAKTKAFSYDPSPYKYEPNLSILDVLMWNSPAAVGDAIRQCVELVQADTSRPGAIIDLQQLNLKS